MEINLKNSSSGSIKNGNGKSDNDDDNNGTNK